MYMYHIYIYIKLSLQSYNHIMLITFYMCLSNTLRTPLHSRLIHLGYIANHYPAVTISMTTVIEMDRCYTDVHRNAAIMYIYKHVKIMCMDCLNVSKNNFNQSPFYTLQIILFLFGFSHGHGYSRWVQGEYTSCTRTSRPMTWTCIAICTAMTLPSVLHVFST